jgi:predicted metalloendopeptidase
MPDNPNNPSSANNENAGPQSVQFAALALRSFGQVCDMQLSAARTLMQTQARAASALGLPDWSGLFNQMDERTRTVFSAGTEQLLQTAQRANEAASQLQREVGRMVETQAQTVAETFQQGIEQLGSQTSDSLNQWVETTRQQAQQAERVASSIGQEVRDSMQQASRQGASELQRAQDALREAGERGASATHSALGALVQGNPGEGPSVSLDDKGGKRNKTPA